MSDIIDLLAAQLLKDNASEANPYSGAGAGISAALATMPQYNLKPWESLLAGALGGFASGALKGYGQQSQDQKTAEIVNKFTAALDETGGLDTKAVSASPELAKYAPMLKLNEMQEKKELKKQQEKMLLDALSKAPTMRTIYQGDSSIQQEFDPLSRTWAEVGSGSRFKPSAGPGPVNQQLLDALVQTGNLAPEIAAAVQSQQDLSAAQRAIGQSGVQNRFETTKDLEKKKTSLFGYEPIDDSFMLQPSELDNLRTKVGATQDIIAKLGVLQGKDLTQIAGQDSATQQATSALMFQAFRNKTGSGANLTKNEETLIQQMMPHLASNDLVGAINAGLLGRDQNQFSRDLQGILQEGLDVELFAQGLKRKSRDLSSYPKQLRDTMGVVDKLPSAQRVEQESEETLYQRILSEERAKLGLK
jgi:hypothetical protein